MENLNFGKKLIAIRKQKGLTQGEVAEKCNLTTRTIQRIESGVVEPRASTIRIISQNLGFDFFDLSNSGSSVNDESNTSKLEKYSFLWYVTDLFNLKTNAVKKISILSVPTFIFLFVGYVSVTAQAEAKSDNIYIADERICDLKGLPFTQFTVGYPNGLDVEKPTEGANHLILKKKIDGIIVEEFSIGYSSIQILHKEKSYNVLNDLVENIQKEMPELKIKTIGKKEFNGEMTYLFEGNVNTSNLGNQRYNQEYQGDYKVLFLIPMPKTNKSLNAVLLTFWANEQSDIKTFSDFADTGMIGQVYQTFKYIE